MQNTLENNSGIWIQKSKFFLYRALIYSLFLLIPVFTHKTSGLNAGIIHLLLFSYIFFILGQWFLLGKELDHRLNIFFRVNSSMDRVIYRLIIGMMVLFFFFNIISFLPGKWINNLFWTTWIALGIFYSWPTRGKIIEESMSSNFGELQYLDAFEKTLLGIIIALFIISIPELPTLTTTEALKLYLDPYQKTSSQLWNFFHVLYYPFKNHPYHLKVAWCLHFYIIGSGIFLFTLYSLLRYFFSRRISLLGVFAILSSWSFSKILSMHLGPSLTSSFAVIWVWATIWIIHNASYRTGLFLGLLAYWGSVLDVNLFVLSVAQALLLYFWLLDNKTLWFKRKLLRYSLFGFGMALVTVWGADDLFEKSFFASKFFPEFFAILEKKSFFMLSYLGMALLVIKAIAPENSVVKKWPEAFERINPTLLLVFVMFLFSSVFQTSLLQHFALLWLLAFLSLMPLELIFLSLSRIRSNRNFLFLVYILICLLDSHVEVRLKVLAKLFH